MLRKMTKKFMKMTTMTKSTVLSQVYLIIKVLVTRPILYHNLQSHGVIHISASDSFTTFWHYTNKCILNGMSHKF